MRNTLFVFGMAVAAFVLLLAGCGKEKSNLPNVPAQDPAQVAATQYINTHREELGMRPEVDQFSAFRSEEDEFKMTHVSFRQYYRSVRVEAGELIVHLDSTLQIKSVTGVWFRNIEVDMNPYYSSSDGAYIAHWYYSEDGKSVANQATVQRVILRWEEVDHLCWSVILQTRDGTERREYFVDAHDGEVLYWRYLAVT